MAPMNVQEEIDRVARYGQRLQDLLDGKELELSGDRDALLIAHWNLLLDYHVAIVTLLAQELHGAAFALMRSIIEAWVRIHVAKIGSDAEVLAIEEDKYQVNFKTIGARIDGAFALNGFFEKTAWLFTATHTQEPFRSRDASTGIPKVRSST